MTAPSLAAERSRGYTPFVPLSRLARLLLLAAALTAPARAGVVGTVGPEPVFAPALGAWSSPMKQSFADPTVATTLPGGLSGLAFAPDIAPRELAPLIVHLEKGLGLKPKSFEKLDPLQRKAALEMAVDEAKEDVRGKVWALLERARAVSSPGKTLDKAGRAELYAVVAQAMEVREHYAAWIDDPEVERAVEESYSISTRRAWEVRTSLLGETETGLGGGSAAAPAVALTPEQAAYVLSPSPAAVALREQMKLTKSGWGQDDLDTLYRGYGFTLRQSKHRVYSHPLFPQLYDSVSRQNDLPPGYASSALKLIAELERLTDKSGSPPAGRDDGGPPASFKLEDLSVLLSPPSSKPVAEKDPAPVVVRREKPRKTAVAPVVRPADEAPEKTEPVATLEPPTVHEPEKKPEPTLPEKTESDDGVVGSLRAVWRRLIGR